MTVMEQEDITVNLLNAAWGDVLAQVETLAPPEDVPLSRETQAYVYCWLSTEFFAGMTRKTMRQLGLSIARGELILNLN